MRYLTPDSAIAWSCCCPAELTVLYISHVFSSSTVCCAPAVFKAFCCAVVDVELCAILSYITVRCLKSSDAITHDCKSCCAVLSFFAVLFLAFMLSCVLRKGIVLCCAMLLCVILDTVGPTIAMPGISLCFTQRCGFVLGRALQQTCVHKVLCAFPLLHFTEFCCAVLEVCAST